MSEGREIGVGVIGLGFMGRTHVAAYLAAHRSGLPCRLRAVCDRSQERRSGVSDSSGNLSFGAGQDFCARSSEFEHVTVYAEPDELLADESVQLVSICTYTDTHVDLALRALEAGKHVLVEKPVAVASRDVERLGEAVSKARGQVCMPAMCMRFWPGWDWLKEQVDKQTYGPVHSAWFQRLGCRPDWASEFYRDADRCGAALVDLHIHDADFIRWCFGDPDAVVSAGSIDHLTTIYRYQHGPDHIVAEGGWDQAEGSPFRIRFVVNFAEATVDFDLGRDQPLFLSRAGRSEPVPLSPLTAYELEVRYMVDAIISGRIELRATVDDATAVARLLEAERLSLETGAIVRL